MKPRSCELIMNGVMTRLFVVTTATLTAIIGVLVGMLLSMPRPAPPRRAPTPSASAGDGRARRVAESPTASGSPPTSINFADIAARLNPAVVNIDATRPRAAARAGWSKKAARRGPDDPFDLGRAAATRRGAAPAPAS